MILITGCAGYIGSNLAERLIKDGFNVRGLILPEEMERVSHLVKIGLEVWKGDLLKPETLRGISRNVSIIYHLAGGHFSTVKKIEDIYVEGTRLILEDLNTTKIKAVVIASNGAVYGDCGQCVIKEDFILNPIHPFGRITLKMEQMLFEYQQKKGVPVIILRIAEVYGEGKYNFIKNASFQNLSLLGNGENYNSRIHIEDVLRVLKLAPSKLVPGEVYNVTDDLPVKQIEFYSEISEILGITLPRWIPMEDVTERIKLSIHGLRSLSLRMSGEKIKRALDLNLEFPTYKEGINYLLRNE